MLYRILIFLTATVGIGCVDPFEPETITFESALVVEATITDEMKTQEIFLSRTFEFEADGPERERNAIVSISDDAGNRFDFQEISEGTYHSVLPFMAQVGRSYNLRIQTSDGRSYSSETSRIPDPLEIERLYAERIINADGNEGVGIFVDSFDPSGNSRNYRYLYEETYRIIAPKWTEFDLLSTGVECGVDVVPKTQEDRVCYQTDLSTDLIITETNGFQEDRVTAFLVRFINRNNFILSHRYSVLVKQLVQSNTAYDYFETLKDFSGSESLFADTQVGFLNGNVFSDIDQDEKVLGYFDVAAVSEQRIFFNWEDLFPGEEIPPFVNECVETAPLLISPGGARCVLAPQVEEGIVSYVNPNDPPIDPGGPYRIVPRVCGDCTVLGKIEVPEFWTEE